MPRESHRKSSRKAKKKNGTAARHAKPQPARNLLRHTVATLAYRAAKALRGAPATFADFRAAETSRTAGQIVAHLGDLFDWALSLAKGKHQWRESPVLDWDRGVERFFAALGAFDAHLASHKPLGFSAERLFQGPVADALTHVGQIAMLRRLAGSPVKGENYFRAEIVPGRVGPGQSPPAFEFD
ncbi:MAG TPA: hypothetical protein VGT03_00220 [Candidatus Acidoferrales bacterium]|nr:hypothetical protein [Candidatus Acidoferrales bacterium]